MRDSDASRWNTHVFKHFNTFQRGWGRVGIPKVYYGDTEGTIYNKDIDVQQLTVLVTEN